METVTYKLAKIMGLIYYFTGKPCKHSHISKRFVSNHVCYDCNRTSTKQFHKNNPKYVSQYLEDNKEHNKQLRKRNYKNNKEYFKYLNGQYYKNNREHIKQIVKNYYKNNPDKIALRDERRHRFLKERTPIWYEVELVRQIYLKRDELNVLWNTTFQVDHIIPITSDTVCGLHCWANLQLLEASPNQSKHNNYEQDW